MRFSLNYLACTSACIIMLSASIASAESFSTMNQGGFHCPYNAIFAAVEIQTTTMGQSLLRCINQTGSTYYAEKAMFSIGDDDKTWLRQTTPPAWICFGNQPEDCRYFR